MSVLNDSMCVLFLINDATKVDLSKEQLHVLHYRVVNDLNNLEIPISQVIGTIMEVMGTDWRPSNDLLTRYHHFFESLPVEVRETYPQLIIQTVDIP